MESPCPSVRPSVAGHWDIAFSLKTNRDKNFVFGMHMYLMEMQLLSRVWSRSRSQVKVKTRIYENFTLLITSQIFHLQA